MRSIIYVEKTGMMYTVKYTNRVSTVSCDRHMRPGNQDLIWIEHVSLAPENSLILRSSPSQPSTPAALILITTGQLCQLRTS